jgi:hypothetical protein
MTDNPPKAKRVAAKNLSLSRDGTVASYSAQPGRRFRPSSGQVLGSAFIHQRLSSHDGGMSKVVLILLIWAGPALLLLAIGAAAVARARLSGDRRKKEQSVPRAK